jgi:hypothetical protein
MPRSIFEQTSHEMIVVRKNLTNTNLSLDEGKIERMRESESAKTTAIYTSLYIDKKKKDRIISIYNRSDDNTK